MKQVTTIPCTQALPSFSMLYAEKREGLGVEIMTFMHGWACDLNNTDLTFDNYCLVPSWSASWLSEGRSLEKVSALYIETVNYSKSIRMTFGSLYVACLWSAYSLSMSTSHT